jgi:hypothetical protein
MEDPEEIRRKLAALAAHKEDYDAANKAMRYAGSERVRYAMWQALETAHAEYMHTWNWLEDHSVQFTWNAKEKQYEEVPPLESSVEITPIGKQAIYGKGSKDLGSGLTIKAIVLHHSR